MLFVMLICVICLAAASAYIEPLTNSSISCTVYPPNTKKSSASTFKNFLQHARVFPCIQKQSVILTINSYYQNHNYIYIYNHDMQQTVLASCLGVPWFMTKLEPSHRSQFQLPISERAAHEALSFTHQKL